MFRKNGFHQPGCPPPVEISSGRLHRPCRQESTTRPGQAEPIGCSFRELCAAVAPRLDVIEWAYGPDIRVTLAERSTSIVVRAEQQFHNKERHRITVRKHFCELTKGVPPAPRTALDCHDLTPGEEYGEYLGFVDLRTAGYDGSHDATGATLAMGLLAPPRRFRSSEGTFLITGSFGPIFGGPSFPSTIYSMHDPAGGGAYCAHACLTMAVAMLGDRGARLKGPYTLTFLGAPRRRLTAHPPPQRGPADMCLGHGLSDPGTSWFDIHGLTPTQCQRVLRDAWTGVSARLVWVEKDHCRLPEPVMDCIVRAYVSARFPVIFFVDAPTWYGHDLDLYLDPQSGQGETGHAVVVVGFQRNPSPPIPVPAVNKSQPAVIAPPDQMVYLVHDPGQVPFLPVPSDQAFGAGWQFQRCDSPHFRAANHLTFLPVADCGVTVHLDECVRFLRGEEFQYDFVLHRERPILSPTIEPDQAALVTAFRPYVDGVVASPAVFELRMILADRHDLSELFAAPENRQSIGAGMDALFRLPELSGRRFWCISGYEWGRLGVLFLFDAEDLGRAVNEISPAQGALRLAVQVRPVDGGHEITALWRPYVAVVPTAKVSGTAGSLVVPDGSKRRELEASVLTSSSSWRLADLLGDLVRVAGVRRFEPLLLRNEDIREVFGKDEQRASTELLASPDAAARVESWLVDTFQVIGADLSDECRPRIACLATYFPGITSQVGERRAAAIRALTAVVLMAIRLRRDHALAEVALVEAVCGAVIDPCPCDVCRAASRCYCSTRQVKLGLLRDSLREVVRAVRKVEPDEPFRVCLEVEPGETYVLNGVQPVEDLLAEVSQDPELRDHVALNADIIHLLGCSPPVPADQLARWGDWIGHGHVCDQPSMHTIDQPMGTWTSVCQVDSAYMPYFRVLARRAADGKRPFSGCVSVELESNDRMECVYRSVSAVRHLTGMAVAGK